MNNNKEYNLYATAAFGLEGIVGAELKRLKMQNVRAELGGARFTGTLTDAFLCNLRLRSADRVLIVLAEDECRTFEELFQLVKSIAWEDIMPADAKIERVRQVRPQSINERPRLSGDYQKSHHRAAESGDATARIGSRRTRQRCTPSTSRIHVRPRAASPLTPPATALNRRGYRTWNGEAPLRETLAAVFGGAHPRGGRGCACYDPMLRHRHAAD